MCALETSSRGLPFEFVALRLMPCETLGLVRAVTFPRELGLFDASVAIDFRCLVAYDTQHHLDSKY